jgi:thiamine biosynthesis lipoprotein
VLVGLGGDFATAGDAPAGGWRVRVTDDHRSGVDAPGQWISIASGGLATSSTTVRRWRAGSDPEHAALHHHLINPATGASVASVWRTVSVTAASCLDANIASTAAVVRGAVAVDWLSALGLPSRLVSTAGTVMHVAGWPREGDDLAADVAPVRAVEVAW